MKKDIKNEVYNDWTLKKCLVPQYVELKMENFMELFMGIQQMKVLMEKNKKLVMV